MIFFSKDVIKSSDTKNPLGSGFNCETKQSHFEYIFLAENLKELHTNRRDQKDY
jgi:hypothetical protein